QPGINTFMRLFGGCASLSTLQNPTVGWGKTRATRAPHPTRPSRATGKPLKLKPNTPILHRQKLSIHNTANPALSTMLSSKWTGIFAGFEQRTQISRRFSKVYRLFKTLLYKSTQMWKAFNRRVSFRVGTGSISANSNQVAVLLIA